MTTFKGDQVQLGAYLRLYFHEVPEAELDTVRKLGLVIPGTDLAVVRKIADDRSTFRIATLRFMQPVFQDFAIDPIDERDESGWRATMEPATKEEVMLYAAKLRCKYDVIIDDAQRKLRRYQQSLHELACIEADLRYDLNDYGLNRTQEAVLSWIAQAERKYSTVKGDDLDALSRQGLVEIRNYLGSLYAIPDDAAVGLTDAGRSYMDHLVAKGQQETADAQ